MIIMKREWFFFQQKNDDYYLIAPLIKILNMDIWNLAINCIIAVSNATADLAMTNSTPFPDPIIPKLITTLYFCAIRNIFCVWIDFTILLFLRNFNLSHGDRLLNEGTKTLKFQAMYSIRQGEINLFSMDKWIKNNVDNHW